MWRSIGRVRGVRSVVGKEGWVWEGCGAVAFIRIAEAFLGRWNRTAILGGHRAGAIDPWSVGKRGPLEFVPGGSRRVAGGHARRGQKRLSECRQMRGGHEKALESW